MRARIKGTLKAEDLAASDIVIEAIIENVEEKKKMFARLDQLVQRDAIFATNTSSVSRDRSDDRNHARRPIHRDAFL